MVLYYGLRRYCIDIYCFFGELLVVELNISLQGVYLVYLVKKFFYLLFNYNLYWYSHNPEDKSKVLDLKFGVLV